MRKKIAKKLFNKFKTQFGIIDSKIDNIYKYYSLQIALGNAKEFNIQYTCLLAKQNELRKQYDNLFSNTRYFISNESQSPFEKSIFKLNCYKSNNNLYRYNKINTYYKNNEIHINEFIVLE